MDEAISRAEREATDAAGFANKAQEQLVEWTDGEKSVIAQLQKMAKVLESPAFVSVTNAFVEQHKSVFDFTDENKFEYSALQEQYVELMEATLVEHAKEVNMDELITNLPEFMKGRAHSKDPEGTGATIDFLVSITEFDAFKQMMLSAKMADGADSGLALSNASTKAGGALDALSGKLRMEAKVVERAQVLLKLGQDDGAFSWRTLSEKKGVYTLEMCEAGEDRFMRVNHVMRLPMEHAIAAHCNWVHPDYKRWDDMWSKIEPISEKDDGIVHDYTARMHLKLPGVMRLIPSIPKSVVMRCCIERDVPKKGSCVVVWCAWDTVKSCVDTGPMGFVRIAMMEPLGEDSVSFINVSKIAPVLPGWIAGLFMSNTIMAGMQSATQKYKKIKGLA